MLLKQRRRALPFLGYRKLVARYNSGRDNKSFNRSGVSGLLIRETRMLLDLDRRPVNSTVMWLFLDVEIFAVIPGGVSLAAAALLFVALKKVDLIKTTGRPSS